MEINNVLFPQLLEEDSKTSIKNLYTYINELLLMPFKNQNKFFLSYVWATDFQKFAFLISLSASCKLLICNYTGKHIKRTNNSVSFFHQPYLVDPILYRKFIVNGVSSDPFTASFLNIQFSYSNSRLLFQYDSLIWESNVTYGSLFMTMSNIYDEAFWGK